MCKLNPVVHSSSLLGGRGCHKNNCIYCTKMIESQDCVHCVSALTISKFCLAELQHVFYEATSLAIHFRSHSVVVRAAFRRVIRLEALDPDINQLIFHGGKHKMTVVHCYNGRRVVNEMFLPPIPTIELESIINEELYDGDWEHVRYNSGRQDDTSYSCILMKYM